MRLFLGGLLVLFCAVGCGESKPDPRSRPDFVDTSDPTKVQMPALPPGGSGGAQPAGQAPGQ